MTQLETELVWLTKKVSQDKEVIEGAEEYYRSHRHMWSKKLDALFFKTLEAMQDQLYFEESRLEKVAWKVVMERDANTDSQGKRLL